MGGAFGTFWETEEVHTVFSWRDLRDGDHLEEGSVDWRIILKRNLQK
jgi:hypothetical protein